MPNWCYTRYVIESEPKQIMTFKRALDKLSSREKPLIENGFGKLWIGVIVHLLGNDWHTVRCRGQITDYSLEEGTLRLDVESAWCELDEARTIFQQKFPGARVYYQSEEPGMEIYTINDTSGKYFTARYIVDSEKSGMEYFDTLSEAATYVQDLTGIETEETAEGIQKAIDVWSGEDPDTRWISFHEFAEVE